MARIVPGFQQQPTYDTGAILRGYDQGSRFRLREEENARRNQALQMQLMQALAKMQTAKAKAIEDAQKKAQMGDAQSMQNLAMAAKSGALDPAQSMLDSMNQMLTHTQDPAARAVLKSSIDSVTTALKQHQEKATAQEAIKRAATNGWIDEEDYNNQVAAGTTPASIMAKLHKVELDVHTKAKATDDSQVALEQMRQLVQTAPSDYRRQKASIMLKAFEADPYSQAKPGEAQKVLEAMRNALLETTKEKGARMQRELGPDSRAPGLGGMTTGERSKQLEREPHGLYGAALGSFGGPVIGGPKIPPYTGGTHATVKGGRPAPAGAPDLHAFQDSGLGAHQGIGYSSTYDDTPQLPADKIKAATSSQEITRLLQEAGIPLTREIAAQVQSLRSGRGR